MKIIALFALASLAFSLTACSNGASFGIAPKEDSFGTVALYNNKVDIIWLVDDSRSMSGEQKKLAQQMPKLVEQLHALKMDYRMVITTTSVGTGLPGGKYVGQPAILTPSTPNMGSLLASRLLVGDKGSDWDRGIVSLQNILADSYVNGDGAGFHREDSLLLINVLTDSDADVDGSAANSVPALIERLNEFKRPYRPNVGGWVVNFIGVTSEAECPSDLGNDETGYRYLELVNASGGKAYPICDASLEKAVKGLQARLLEIITDYPLSDIPNLDTVQVYKNGALVPRSSVNGWSYVPELNVIRFHGTAVPSADSSIKVSFTPASAS